MNDLYAQDSAWHGYTKGGNKAHRIYRPSRFPQRLIACTSLPVAYAFLNDLFPDAPADYGLRVTDWCLRCYPAADAGGDR